MRAFTKSLMSFFGFEDRADKLRKLRHTPRLGLERMEDRAVPATFLVTSTGDNVGDTGSLRYAVTQANLTPDADVIEFAPALNGQTLLIQPLPQIVHDLTITGPGVNQLTLKPPVTGSLQSNPVSIAPGVTASISGMTIAGFSTQPGGGRVGGTIYNAGTLTVSDVRLANNRSDSTTGTGIYNDVTGDLTVTNVTFEGNAANGFNAAGGGVYNRGTAAVSDSTFVGNSVYQFGGAIANVGDTTTATATLTITRTTIDHNSVFTGFGGGIYSKNGTLTLTDSTLTGNSANTGGGLYLLNTTATVTNSTIAGNGKVNATGGGAYLTGGTLSLTNATVVGNTGGFGGGVFAAGTFTLGNTIIAGNSAATASDSYGNFLTNGNNLIGSGFGAFGTWAATDQVGTTANPIDPLLGPLAANGGPTRTMAPLVGSPAIDRGGNALAVDPVTSQPLAYDQRGAGFARAVGGTVDIGAVESAPSNQAPTIEGESAAVSADEGGTLSTAGTFDDPDGNDTVTITAEVGGVPFGTVSKDDALGTWNWSAPALDGDAGPFTVTIRADDGVAAPVTTTFTYTVTNVAPTAVLSTNTGITYGAAAVVSLDSPFDPGSADAAAGFRYAFSLGTDTTGSATYSTSGGSSSADFGVLDAGTYTVFARVIDKDGGFTPYSTTLTVNKAASVTTTSGAGPFTYDGSTHAGGSGTVTGVNLSTGATSFTYTGDRTNAGVYYVTAHYAGDANHEPSSGAAVAVAINKAAVSHAVGNASHVYGGTADLAAALGSTILTGVNGETLSIAYASPGNTTTADAGSYAITGVVSNGTGLAANYDLTLTPGVLTVTRAVLTGNATTQSSLNMAKQGKLTITVGNIGGLANGDTLAAFLSTAHFFITVGSNRYEFVPTSVTTSGSSVTVTYDMKNPALKDQLAAELADNTSAANAVTAGFSMTSQNYTFDDADLTRLFSTAG